jgi:hypothetical protein
VKERPSYIPFQVPLHLVSPLSFYPPIGGDLLELGRLLINKDSTIEDLKFMILTLPAVSHPDYVTNKGPWAVYWGWVDIP